MDKHSKLSALEGKIIDDILASPWNEFKVEPREEEKPLASFLFPTKMPQHIYEGTDSEEEDGYVINAKSLKTTTAASGDPSIRAYIQAPPRPDVFNVAEYVENDFSEYGGLEQGQLAMEGESFCPWQTIRKYPYSYVGVANSQRVAEGFFDQGKVFDNTWDLFYIYRRKEDPNQQPILLVPTRQFQHFLHLINSHLKTNLTIPQGGANGAFEVTFVNDGTPLPRYLGRSTNESKMADLKENVPPRYYKLENEPPGTDVPPSDRSLAAFQAKMALIVQSSKGKKTANKEKSKRERIEKQAQWNHTIKRVQRYLGLRENRKAQKAAIREEAKSAGYDWQTFDERVTSAEADIKPTTFNPDEPAPFSQEGSVVFVCVDVEAYERDTKLVTEIGISTFDTEDIASTIPGEGGKKWFPHIRARHFRIKEYKHLNNTEFVTGCADKFEFGASEFISIKDAPQVVASCFKYPFSKSDAAEVDGDEEPRRNIVLVGHDVVADINFLRTIGYDVRNLSTLQETADTASMWRYLKREINPRNLGTILSELSITGWHLHNAGNDAAYTLQAMIGIAVEHLNERQKARDVKEAEKQARLDEAVKDAIEAALEKEEGWSTAGEESDGGVPLEAVPPQPVPKGKKFSDPRLIDSRKPGFQGIESTKSWGRPAPAPYTAHGINERLTQKMQGSSWRPQTQSYHHQSAAANSRGSMSTGSQRGRGDYRSMTPATQIDGTPTTVPTPNSSMALRQKHNTSSSRYTPVQKNPQAEGWHWPTIEPQEKSTSILEPKLDEW